MSIKQNRHVVFSDLVPAHVSVTERGSDPDVRKMRSFTDMVTGFSASTTDATRTSISIFPSVCAARGSPLLVKKSTMWRGRKLQRCDFASSVGDGGKTCMQAVSESFARHQHQHWSVQESVLGAGHAALSRHSTMENIADERRKSQRTRARSRATRNMRRCPGSTSGRPPSASSCS